MKKYSEDFHEIVKQAWVSGGFGPEWNRVRQLAFKQGFPWPPKGTATDERTESQRAIIYESLDNTPLATEAIVSRSTSWSEVITELLEMRLQYALDAAEQDEREAQAKRQRDDRDRRDGLAQRQTVRGYHTQPIRVGELLGAPHLRSHQGRAADGQESGQ